MNSNIESSALVIFSGGQDSTTCLAWALENFKKVCTIGFYYGQRHEIEMTCRNVILQLIKTIKTGWANRLLSDWTTDISLFRELGDTALTDTRQIQMSASGLPNTFVPGRNIFFMLAAAAYAYRQGIDNIIAGICQTDFSGYPDCRDDFAKSMQVALNLGMAGNFTIHTPLMQLDKAQTWVLAKKLGGSKLIELIRESTHTCYLGTRSTKHDWGYGCGDCPACKLRAKGWYRFIENSKNDSFEK